MSKYRELLGLGDKKLTGSAIHRALSGNKKVTKRLALLARSNWNEAARTEVHAARRSK